mgnify:CR=1 FL=1
MLRGVVADDVHLLVALAIEGAGLAYVPDEQVTDGIAEGRLERVLETFITKGPGLYLYFPSRTQEQPRMRALLDVIAGYREEAARSGAKKRARR